MATLYRIESSEEVDKSDAADFAAYNASLMRANYPAVFVSGEIKPLRGVTEFHLKEYNENPLSASLKGILLQVERRICLQCGGVFESARIVFSESEGCLPSFVVSLGAFALFIVVFKVTTIRGFLLYPLFFTAALSFWQMAGTVYISLRFSQQQARLARERCPACGSPEFAAISTMVGKRVHIGTEGKWVQVAIGGRA